MAQSLPLLELLYDALRAEVGVIVETESPERLRQKLYGLRKESDELAGLHFVISPTNPAGELWILKDKINAQDE